MKGDPLLAHKDLPKQQRIYAYGGLHYLKGNKTPYFALTGELLDLTIRRSRDEQIITCGCMHEELLKHFPDLADLVAMHLSDMDGTPMHAEANGWYWLEASFPNPKSRYHGGNAMAHYGGEWRKPTKAECLTVFAEHCRIPVFEAEIIRTTCRTADAARQEDGGPGARATWAKLCEQMNPRWKMEADACIAKHNLQVYGDPWP